MEAKYFVLIVRLLRLMGAWPGDDPGAVNSAPPKRVFVTFAFYVIAFSAVVNQLRLSSSDIPALTQCLSVAGAFLVSFHKLLVLSLHRPTVARLVAAARRPLLLQGESEETVAYVGALTRLQDVYTMGLLLTSVVTVGFMMVRPLLQLLLLGAPAADAFANATLDASVASAPALTFDPTLPLVITVPVPASVSASRWGHVWLYVLHCMFASYHVVAVPALDGFFAALMLRAACRLRLLRAAFERLHEDAAVTAVTTAAAGQGSGAAAAAPLAERLRATLTARVKEHQDILDYLKQLENVQSPAMMSQFFMSSALIPCSAFQIVSFPNDLANLTSQISFLSGGLIQLGAYCAFGDSIKQETDAVGVSAYMSDWVGAGRAHADGLRMVLVRSRYPARLTIGRFLELSLQTYAAILKGSFTYFTLLTELQG